MLPNLFGCEQVHIGNIEEALAFFREAVRRLPRYALANQHLAETLQKLGKEDEAVQTFEDLVKRSKNPEFAAGLAKLYRTRCKLTEAGDLVARARKYYEALLVDFPEAMSWHAAEFFRVVIKDPARAAELLKKNSALRPNSASFTALARAELAAGDVDGASASIDTALVMPLECAGLYWVAARVHEKGDDLLCAKAGRGLRVLRRGGKGLSRSPCQAPLSGSFFAGRHGGDSESIHAATLAMPSSISGAKVPMGGIWWLPVPRDAIRHQSPLLAASAPASRNAGVNG